MDGGSSRVDNFPAARAVEAARRKDPEHDLKRAQREDIQMPSQNGNGGQRGPWGSGAKSRSDLEALVRQGQDQLKQLMPSGGVRPAIVLAVLALVGLAAWTAYYTVPSDSVAVVQRFGKYLKDVPPGLHFKLPLGVDVATIVPVKRQLKEEFGFATAGATDPYQIPRDAKQETQMVTGDLNAALVEWVVQYRISDPVKFLFDVREPRGTLRDVSESVMREVVDDRTVDEVITDAKATEIYAGAYNQSPEAVAFYEFTRTMQSYKSIIAENTTLVLSTGSDLFKFLKGMSPDGDVVPAPRSAATDDNARNH
jgi:regulator of protease activity HflC (stomatin/prohibitin superfamily)